MAHDAADAGAGLRLPHRLATASLTEQLSGVTFMFPGQGAQHPGMARELYAVEPVFRADVDRSARLLESALALDLRDLLFPVANDEHAAKRLQQTALAQPALFVVSHALAQLWMSWGVRPSALVGHSVGELVAACLAGVFSVQDATALLATRGRLMQEVAAGAMLSVRLSTRDLEQWLGAELDLAAVNSPALSVVAGPIAAVESLEQQLCASNIPHRRLHTSHAFHSRMMDGLIDPFEREIRQLSLRAPTLPILSTVSGRWLTTDEALSPRYWAEHLRRTVNFAQALSTLRATRDALLEVGPGQTLTTLAKGTPGSPAQLIVPSLGHADGNSSDSAAMLHAAGRLWLSGAPIDWAGMHAADPRSRVPLPTYPFERKRYWIEGATFSEARPSPPEVHAETDIGPPAAADDTLSDAEAHRLSLSERLREIVNELSGIPAEEISADATFLDLGLDSLLLTQVSKACHDAFGVKITMRQLLDDTSTPDAVVSLLADRLPAPERPRAAVASSPRRSVGASGNFGSQSGVLAAKTPTPPSVAESGPPDRALVEHVVQQQLALMAEQLRLLGGSSSLPQSAAEPVASPQHLSEPLETARNLQKFFGRPRNLSSVLSPPGSAHRTARARH